MASQQPKSSEQGARMDPNAAKNPMDRRMDGMPNVNGNNLQGQISEKQIVGSMSQQQMGAMPQYNPGYNPAQAQGRPNFQVPGAAQGQFGMSNPGQIHPSQLQQMKPNQVQGGVPPSQPGQMQGMQTGGGMQGNSQFMGGKPPMTEASFNQQKNQIQAQANYMNQLYKTNMTKFFKEEVPSFSYTVTNHFLQKPIQNVSQPLEELYHNQQNTYFKALYSLQSFPAYKRPLKSQEPIQQCATHQDFMLEEMVNMSIDFQEETRFKRVQALKIAREAQREVSRRVAEKRKIELEAELKRNAVQIEDIIPEMNGGLQKMVSLSGLLGDLDQQAPAYDDGLNYFNQDDGQNFVGEMNFDDPQYQMNPVDNRPPSMIAEEIKQPNDLLNPEQKKQDLVEVGGKPMFLPWIAQNVEKQLELVIAEERDLVDQVDLFYPFERNPSVINLAPREETKSEEIPSTQFIDKAEEKQNMAIQAAVQAFEQKIGKFSDVILAKFNKKQEEKQRKKKNREILQAMESGQPIPPFQSVSVDQFLINTSSNSAFMDPLINQNQFNMQNNFQLPQQQQLQRTPSAVYPGKALPDIDYKKPKFNLFMQNDIFTKCIDPADYLSLKDLKDRTTKEDQDEVMSEASPLVEEQMMIAADKANSNFEEDYYQCLVAKPKNAADYPYQAEEDVDMLNLIPEQNEPILFELVNKVTMERKRKQALLECNPNNTRFIKEIDILLNEKQFQEQIKHHKQNLDFMNQESNIDQRVAEQSLGKSASIKKQLNSIEQSFMNWYASIFGDEFRLIADIINYHPFTRGRFRDPEELRFYYFAYNDQKGVIYSAKLQLEPKRLVNLPILLNQRPPSLFINYHQPCLIHKFNQRKGKSLKLKIGLVEDPNTKKIGVKYLQAANKGEQTKSSMLGKRARTADIIEESKSVALAKFEQQVNEELNFNDEDASTNDLTATSNDSEVYPMSNKLYHGGKNVPILGDIRTTPIDSYVKAEDSPMINSLTMKKGQRIKSIRKKEAIIYWIAYLQKKLYQQDVQLYVELLNLNYQSNSNLENYRQNSTIQIQKRVNISANEIADQKREQLMKARGFLPQEYKRESKEEIEARKRKAEIERSIHLLDFSRPNYVNQNEKSIYTFEKDSAIQMLNAEVAQVQFERTGEHLRRYFDKKWDSMDLTWYQQHRNLGPKDRKGNPSQRYSDIFLRYFKQWDKMQAEQMQLANHQQLAPSEKPRPTLVQPANSFLPYPKNNFPLIAQAYSKKNEEIQREILQINAAFQHQQQQNANNMQQITPNLVSSNLPLQYGSAEDQASIGIQPQQLPARPPYI